MQGMDLFVGRGHGAPGAASIGLLGLRLVAGCGFMLLILTGPGRFSLDALIQRRTVPK